jgi:hypothetical protein
VRGAGTVGRMDAAAEPTGTYSRRVPAARAGPAAPDKAGSVRVAGTVGRMDAAAEPAGT